MLIEILQDGFFAALAAIGFASISNPPKQAYACSAIAAALGHSLRYVLMTSSLHVHIILASTIAAFVIGLSSVYLSKIAKCPAEACFAPALLPMIPGMYAYRSMAALIKCLSVQEQDLFLHYLYLLRYNGFTCVFIVLGMVVGATVPVFLFKKVSFGATR